LVMVATVRALCSSNSEGSKPFQYTNLPCGVGLIVKPRRPSENGSELSTGLGSPQVSGAAQHVVASHSSVVIEYSGSLSRSERIVSEKTEAVRT
jgi:hypothetical protein